MEAAGVNRRKRKVGKYVEMESELQGQGRNTWAKFSFKSLDSYQEQSLRLHSFTFKKVEKITVHSQLIVTIKKKNLI